VERVVFVDGEGRVDVNVEMGILHAANGLVEIALSPSKEILLGEATL
jgi:hypothetical protein